MGSYVVRISNFENLVNEWRGIVTDLCGDGPVETFLGRVHTEWNHPYVPSPTLWEPGEDEETVLHKKQLKARGFPFFELQSGICESLRAEQWRRIQWFYYCDNDLGNTLRLYDTDHFETPGNDMLYLGLWEGKFPDRVVIRGENLEKENHALKNRLLDSFDERHTAASAPGHGLPRTPIDVMGRCPHYVAKRHAYFQHECHNNMPNNQPFSCGRKCYDERPHNLCGLHADVPPPRNPNERISPLPQQERNMPNLWDYAQQTAATQAVDAIRHRASRLLNFLSAGAENQPSMSA